MGFSQTIDFGEGLLELLELGLIAVLGLWIRLLHKRLRVVEDRQHYVQHLANRPTGCVNIRQLSDNEIFDEAQQWADKLDTPARGRQRRIFN